MLQLLTPDLLRHRSDLAAIDRTVRALGASIGWHYQLDIIWILQQLRARQIRPRATVVDLGAGLGVLQFVLARLGYRVISVDFSDRRPSLAMRLTHSVRVRRGEQFSGAYLDHLGKATPAARSNRVSRIADLLLCGLPMVPSRLSGGSIEFVRSDMRDLAPLADRSVDAVVSVSAIEHLDKAEVPAAIAAAKRVLKPRGPMLITTSAAEAEDWFHEPSRGWNFSTVTLASIFGIQADRWDGDFRTALAALNNCTELQKRLHPSYRMSDKNGMPWGIWKPVYVPVGVAI